MKINTILALTLYVIYFLSQNERQKGVSGQKSKGTNLSPLIMPVSVPVAVTNVLVPQASTHHVML